VKKLELLKELLGDSSVKVDKQRVKYVQEWLQEEIEKEKSIQKQGYHAYYAGKIMKFWQSYGYVLYAVAMVLLIAVLIFQLSAAVIVNLISGIEWIPGVSFLLTALEAIFLIYYIFCKSHHRKWKAAAGIVGLLLLKQIWNLVHGSIGASADMALFLMLFLAVHHYGRYKQEFAEKSESLKQWLRDGAFSNDTIIQLYYALEQVRLEGGRQVSRMQKDDEVDEMLLYLNWLKRDAEAETILEELRADAIAENYDGLVLSQPMETELAEDDAPKEPLTRHNAKQKLAMPMLYIVMFLLFYLPVQWFFTDGKQNQMQGGIIICAGVIAVLLILVIAVFGQQEKNPHRKFWMELIPTLGLELMIVFDVFCLVSGYYTERGARGMKSFLLFLCVGVPWFLSYAGKTQRNWKRIIEPEEKKKTE